MVSDTIYFRAS